MTRHSLGFTNGAIQEHDDGTASYYAPVKFLPSYRVRISDVTGFTETRGGRKSLQSTMHVMGRGGEIASCDINVGATPKIEAWFRSHPDFNDQSADLGAGTSVSVADELSKLARLRDSGILTPEELTARRQRCSARGLPEQGGEVPDVSRAHDRRGIGQQG